MLLLPNDRFDFGVQLTLYNKPSLTFEGFPKAIYFRARVWLAVQSALLMSGSISCKRKGPEIRQNLQAKLWPRNEKSSLPWKMLAHIPYRSEILVFRHLIWFKAEPRFQTTKKGWQWKIMKRLSPLEMEASGNVLIKSIRCFVFAGQRKLRETLQ